MWVMHTIIEGSKEGKWLKCGQINSSLGSIFKNAELTHLRQTDVDSYQIVKCMKVLIRQCINTSNSRYYTFQ